MARLVMDPVVKGEDGATMHHMEERFGRFQNKNTWWRHSENGTLPEFDRLYEDAVERVRSQLGRPVPLVIAGKEIQTDKTFLTKSPADRSLVVADVSWATREDGAKAVAAAKQGFAAWSERPWQERAAVLEKAADLYAKDFYDLCAVMTFETGKTRFEASIDVDEAIDFLRFYALTMREMGGFEMEMGKPFPNEACRSVRRPYGVFSVLCPFNFPVAITTGMTAAALVTGNTAVVKPSPKGCLAGWWCYRLLREAGVPGDALQFLVAGDNEVSAALLEDPDVDGIVFTGSKAVGMMALQKVVAQGHPKPVIMEMGGKNAVIVTDNADLDKAVQGVWKSAFGFSGQKCSACSRVYVTKGVAHEFMARLGKLTQSTTVGPPWQKDSFMGPVTEPRKMELMQEVLEQVKKDGGKILAGGAAVEDLDGYYLQPTLVTGLPLDHRVFREEFFMPFVAVGVVDSLDEAIDEYNNVEYGLTAGVMSEDEAEVERFFDRVQAGVCYANRAAGGCTAAVVNGQSFVGWKSSGSTGHGAGGRYYLLQFTRERSQTVA